LVGLEVPAAPTEESDLEGFALETSYAGERLVENVADEITDRRIGQRGLVLAGTGLQHSMTGTLNCLNAFPPEDRLADPGLTFEQEVTRSVVQVLDESFERGELALSTDDPTSSRRQ
jgi:hypothetical protein